MNDLKRPAKFFIIVTMLLGLLSIGFTLINLHHLDIWLLLLAALTSVTQVFKVEGATEKSNYNLSWVLYGFTFLLFGAPETLVIIVISHLVEWIRYRYPWYIQIFNISAYAVSVLICTLVYNTFSFGQAQFSTIYSVGLFFSLLSFTLTNHFLVGLVIWLARGQNFRESGVFGFLTLTIDFTLMILGVLAALIWQINPLAAFFVLSPIILVQNGLKMPSLQRQTEIDPKTKLFNVKFFQESFEKELALAKRFNKSLTLVLGDLDLLRNINNTYGHMAGDVILLGVAEILKNEFRASDLVARFGGEEFAIMMPGTTPEEAFKIVEAAREAIAAANFEVDTSVQRIKATMSFGISGVQKNQDATITTTDLTNDADSALYHAKMSGRNQTCIYSNEAIDQLFNINQKNQPVEVVEHKPSPISARFKASQKKVEPQKSSEKVPEYPKKVLEHPLQETQNAATHYINGHKPKRPLKTNVYVGFVMLVAVGLAFLGFLKFNGPHDLIGIALFTIIILMTEIFSIEIYSKDSSVSTAAAVLIAGALLFGPLGALILSFTIAFTAMYKSQGPVVRLLFNASNHFIASLMVIILVNRLDITFTATGLIFQIILAMFFGVVVYISSTFLLSGVLHFSQNRPFFQLWQEQFKWLIPYYLGFGIISLAIVQAYIHAGLVGLFAILTPLLILRLGQFQYIDKTKSIVKQLRQTNEELKANNLLISGINEDILLSLANTIDLRDSYTLGHSTCVSQIALRLAQELRLSSEQIDTIRKASLLHDIGKIGIPDRILFKPESLTKEEFEIIKQHPTRGARIVEVNASIAHLAPAIRHHHEHYDGRGYPDGLQAEAIPLEARILCLADSVQAMSSNRPYRGCLELEEVKDEVRANAGTHFDPQLVRIFLELLEKEQITLEIPLWKEAGITQTNYILNGS